MPFVVTGGGRLEDRIDEAAPGRCARRIADAGGDRLKANIRKHTPVGPGGGDRVPGTLRDSIDRTDVDMWPGRLGPTYRVFVRTFDPVGPHVEWDTRPHDIQNAFGFGFDFGIGGRFAGRFHPGTTGAHMFARGTAETDGELIELARGPLNQLDREIFKGRP